MFFSKKKECSEAATIAEKVNCEAEGLYRSGKMHCAEAVLVAVKNNFRPDLPEEVAHLASGFGGGSGTGCLCGAVVGGTIALGLVLPNDRKRVAALTKDLHHWFKGEYHSTCCRTIRGEYKGICAELTGKVAGQVAKMLIEE
jgi:C_GCAxxG_C_C family probable redox protein